MSRRALYVAVLLHDIAKGRGGDHSILGAEVAQRLCPRFGLTPAETETVAWLVRWHLLMSATAFKRDLSDFKTILDFCRGGAEPGAAAPAAGADRRRYPRGRAGRVERLEAPVARRPVRSRPRKCCASATSRRAAPSGSPPSRTRCAARSAGTKRRSRRSSSRLPEAYWIAEPDDVLAHNARFIAERRRRATCRSTRRSIPSAARRWSRSTPPIIRGCSTASPARSTSPAATSSTRASTPRATAWRSTISSSRIRSGGRSTKPASSRG